MRRKALELGENITPTERSVARLEAGEIRYPHPATRRVLTALCGRSMQELGFTRPASKSADVSDAAQNTGYELTSVTKEFPDSESRAPATAQLATDDLGRRAILQGMALLGMPPFFRQTASKPDILSEIPERLADVPPEINGYFRTQIEGHYLADLLLGPRQLIGTVSAQYELLSQLAEAATGERHADLLGTGAAFAGFITWLYQDAGDYYRAGLWAGETLDIAHRVQDTQIISHSLVNKAMLNTDLGDGKKAAELCESAMAPGRKLCAKVRVQAMQQAAHGYSLLDNRTRVDELLDGASNLIAGIDDDYPWGNASRRSPNYIEAQRATCYGRLGLSGEASRIWEQVISRIPESFQRDRGVYIARRAISAADAGQPDIAAALISESAPLAVKTGSARMRQELQTAWQHFEPWRHSAVGKEVSEQLANSGLAEKGP